MCVCFAFAISLLQNKAVGIRCRICPWLVSKHATVSCVQICISSLLFSGVFRLWTHCLLTTIGLASLLWMVTVRSLERCVATRVMFSTSSPSTYPRSTVSLPATRFYLPSRFCHWIVFPFSTTPLCRTASYSRYIGFAGSCHCNFMSCLTFPFSGKEGSPSKVIVCGSKVRFSFPFSRPWWSVCASFRSSPYGKET